jgi:hypothetical protein
MMDRIELFCPCGELNNNPLGVQFISFFADYDLPPSIRHVDL